jgi:hypothetical protein
VEGRTPRGTSPHVGERDAVQVLRRLHRRVEADLLRAAEDRRLRAFEALADPVAELMREREAAPLRHLRCVQEHSLVLASSVLAGCGGLSAKQRLARARQHNCSPHVGLVGTRQPKITSIEIRGGNWADVVVQGPFTVQNDGCVTSASCHPGHAIRALLGFALRDPRQHWNVSYDFGHGF